MLACATHVCSVFVSPWGAINKRDSPGNLSKFDAPEIHPRLPLFGVGVYPQPSPAKNFNPLSHGEKFLVCEIHGETDESIYRVSRTDERIDMRFSGITRQTGRYEIPRTRKSTRGQFVRFARTPLKAWEVSLPSRRRRGFVKRLLDKARQRKRENGGRARMQIGECQFPTILLFFPWVIGDFVSSIGGTIDVCRDGGYQVRLRWKNWKGNVYALRQ